MNKLKYFWILTMILSLAMSCKKKEGCTDVSAVNYDEDAKTSCDNCCDYGSGPGSGAYVLTIKTGARSVPVGQDITYEAVFVNINGEEVAATDVNWSSSSGSLSGSTFTVTETGTAIITARASIDGVSYDASVPLGCTAPSNSLLFTVVPSAILVDEQFDDIQLEPIYLGTESSSFKYEVDNSSIATVSSSGVVSFKSAGTAEIKVTATIGGQESEFLIPVAVVAVPKITLPVAKIVLTPSKVEMFRGEQQQFTAKAYDVDGNDVTSSTSFSWYTETKDQDFSNPLEINSSGQVTATGVGDAYVFATAMGIVAQAEVSVNPDSVLIVDPFFAALGGFDPFTGTQGPTSQVFEAKAYVIDRAKYRAEDPNFLNPITLPGNIKWSKPTSGIPSADALWDVIDLSNNTNNTITATMKSNAVGTTFVIAEVPGMTEFLGVGMVTVGF
ncbi:MAG: Ig-like domain-containing protein [Flavobacteriales bacterium]|nr:Ig-like domain-containing protein [Flavobacteriales bacterium]